jgi:acyl carrier protein
VRPVRAERELDRGGWPTVADWRAAVPALTGWEPDDLRQLGAAAGFHVTVCWSGEPDRFDVWFSRDAAPVRWGSASVLRDSIPPKSSVLGLRPAESWEDYGNRPLRNRQQRTVVPRIRRALAERLPAYLVPTAFAVVDALPKHGASGKVDRGALPPIERSVGGLEQSYEPPRTDMERTIAQVVQSVLTVEKIGRNDNFFDLGAHSLLAGRVVARLREVTGVDVPLRAFFEAPSVGALAQVIGERPAGELEEGEL